MIGVMVDLETFGTKSNAAIVSIGAVLFDTKERTLEDGFYSQINLQSCLDAGLSIDGSTVSWWMKQKEEARKEFFSNENAPSLIEVLMDFSDWFPDDPNVTLWGNGATFDNVILANAYLEVGLQPPWAWYNDRCYRTLKNLYPDVIPKKFGVLHNALDDAKRQAYHLVEIFSKKGLTDGTD